MCMKTLQLTAGFFICVCIQSCTTSYRSFYNKLEPRFLYVTDLDTSARSYGQHIEIRQVLPNTDGWIPLVIEDRDIIVRSGYSRNDELRILKEYLSFKGDKRISNKLYRFKAAARMTKPDVENFTIQIEALFSFTKMLTSTYTSMRPVLLNRITGEKLNGNPKAVDDVFKIYVEWYLENEKSNFQNLSMPLSGSPYCWQGEEQSMEKYLRKTL